MSIYKPPNLSVQDRSTTLAITMPTSYEEVVEEIVRFTPMPAAEVAERVWLEALSPGWNISQDVAKFEVTPHRHNEQMARLYRESDGFIFETLVFWAKPARRRWTEWALARVQQYASRSRIQPAALRILLLGDGTGNDSLFLAKHGYFVDYFDVPGSYTYEFALKRFAYYGTLGTLIRPLNSYHDYLDGVYDVVISFEVLEHLPNPVEWIREIRMLLKPGGIALVTEDFGDITAHLPTHLKSTRALQGLTPFLFLENRMRLSWYSNEELFKPFEFTRVERVSPLDRLALLKDSQVRGAYLARYTGMAARFVGNLPYLGKPA